MKLAYFSPLTPNLSDVSTYSEELLPCLAKYARIDIYIDNYLPTNPIITDSFNIYHYLRYYEKARDYDITLYHWGNTKYCRYIYPFILNHPGIVVLHDPSLPHLNQRIELKRTKTPRKSGPYNSSIIQQIINASWAVVLPNHYEEDQILIQYPQKRVVRIPLFIAKNNLTLEQERNFLRLKRGVSVEECILLSFGTINPSKRIHTTLLVLAKLIQHFPNLRYILAEECSRDYDAVREIRKLNLEKFVYVMDRVDETTLHDYLQMADICLHFRYPASNESDVPLLQCLAAGKPTLVLNYRQYAELPNDCCIKIHLSPSEEYDLYKALYRLIADKSLSFQYGENARNYMMQNYSSDRVALRYAEFLEDVLDDRVEQKIILKPQNISDIIWHITDEINKFQIAPLEKLIRDELTQIF